MRAGLVGVSSHFCKGLLMDQKLLRVGGVQVRLIRRLSVGRTYWRVDVFIEGEWYYMATFERRPTRESLLPDVQQLLVDVAAQLSQTADENGWVVHET